MTYKTIVIDYAPKAKKMAAAIEEKANEMAQASWELVTFSVTNSAKAILIFRTLESAPQGTPAQDVAAPQAEDTPDEVTVQEETAEAVGDAE